MPYNDGTGPEGKGPKTGRGLGDCDTTNNPKLKKMINWRLFAKKKKRVGSKNGSGDGYGDGTHSFNGSGRKNRLKDENA